MSRRAIVKGLVVPQLGGHREGQARKLAGDEAAGTLGKGACAEQAPLPAVVKVALDFVFANAAPPVEGLHVRGIYRLLSDHRLLVEL